MMTQSTITRYFKKEIESVTQSTNTHYIKEEIDINWDERDNCYGEAFDDEQKEYTAKEIIEKLPESVLQKNNTESLAAVQTEPNFSESNEFDCSRCKKNFTNKHVLTSHRAYCGKECDIQCAHCSYKTKYKTCLIRHLSKVHENGKSIHQDKHDHSRKYFRFCEKCNKTSGLSCPTKCERCSSNLIYQCSACAKFFKTRSLAGYHWSTRCGVEGYFNCTKCDFKSVWRSKVIQHMKLMHTSPDLNHELKSIEWISLKHDSATAESNPYKCPKCNKTMGNPIKLSQHLQRCGSLEYTKNTKNVDMLSKNKQVDNVDPKLTLSKCSSCGKQFGHIYSLNDHIRHCKQKMEYMTKVTVDEDIEDVKMDYTSKSLILADKRYARYLQMMVRYCSKCQEDSAIEEINRGIGRKVSCNKCETTLVFKCKKCLKQYTAYKVIKHHLDTTCYPKEEYKCTKCSFKSYIPKSIKAHYFTMHDTANHECKQCGSKFRRRDGLRIHLLRCRGEPIFQCEHCFFKSTRKLYLKRHIFRHHMEPVVTSGGTAINTARLYLKGTTIRLKAYCLKCDKEQRMSNRLKTCAKCKTKLHFQCKICKKTYNAEDKNACNHVKSYLEATKFKCKRCGRGFKLKKYLQSHESHCGTKATFNCRFCKYISNRKATITAHEKVMHFNEA